MTKIKWNDCKDFFGRFLHSTAVLTYEGVQTTFCVVRVLQGIRYRISCDVDGRHMFGKEITATGFDDAKQKILNHVDEARHDAIKRIYSMDQAAVAMKGRKY